jgi:hypothetical protein
LAILSRTETSSLGRTPCVSNASLCGIQVLIDLSSGQWPLELEPRMRIKLFISGHKKSSGSGIRPQSWAGDDYEVSLCTLHQHPQQRNRSRS